MTSSFIPRPCKHVSELALVRDRFYPHHAGPDTYSVPEQNVQQWAIDRVNLWTFKCHRIPHAVVATKYLTDALLHDSQPVRRELISGSAMRSIYAMAFCKFVNGFVDRDVAKSTTAAFLSDQDVDEKSKSATKGESSMHAQAAKIGMPEQFVDLRHEIVHGQELPTRETLRRMTGEALEWLWEKWWKKNATGHPGRALREIELHNLACRKLEESLNSQESEEIGERHPDLNMKPFVWVSYDTG